MSFQKILAAFDFSEPSRRALEFAYKLVRADSGDVYLVHVHPEHYLAEGEPSLTAPWPTPEQSERYIRFLESELRTLVPQDLAGRVRCEVRDGDPKALLLAVAKEYGCDLLCVGATGKRVVDRMLLGSVSHSLIRRSPIPVVTVP